MTKEDEAKRGEKESLLRKIEEIERNKLREEERKHKLLEEERKRKDEAECQRKIYEEEERLRKLCEEEHNIRVKEMGINPLKIGDYKDIGGGYITFGSYPQSKKAEGVQIGEIFDQDRCYYLGSDNNLYACWRNEFYKVEPIKWKVLQKGDDMFIVADDILDARLFAVKCNSNRHSNDYGYSVVRKFINGEFYNKAFNDKQKGKIRIRTFDGKYTWVDGGLTWDATSDNVFLLSEEEVYRYLDVEGRKRVPTEYAVAKGAYRRWWLRSPYSGDNYSVQYVRDSGDLGYDDVERADYGVVPAIRIKP